MYPKQLAKPRKTCLWSDLMIVGLDSNKIKIFALNALKTEQYYCPDPECQKPELILCKGLIVPAYFRHKQIDPSCNYQPESEQHEYAKMRIAQILNLKPDCVEYRQIKGIIPDIFMYDYGLEIQCSKLNYEDFVRRNTIYLQNQLQPLWFFYYSYFQYESWLNYKTNFPSDWSLSLRFPEYQLIYLDNHKLPCFTLDQNKNIILFYIDAPWYHSKKMRNVKEIISFKELSNKNQLLDALRYIDWRWHICKNCNALFLISKKEFWKKVCLSCYKKLKSNHKI